MRHRLWGTIALVALQYGCNAILGNEDHPVEENSGAEDGGAPDSTIGGAHSEAGIHDASSVDALKEDADAATMPEAGEPREAGRDGGCGALGGVHSCSSCTNDCTLLPNVNDNGVACTDERCSYSCAADYGDCADAGAGCITYLGSAGSCGACGIACSGASPVCARPADGGAYACSSGCAAGQANCGGTCSELSSDPANCGACNTLCSLAHATAGCNAASCVIAACATGFADCDQKASTGCEVNTTNDIANCGGCGVACNPAHATPSCTESSCAIATCAAGFVDCDKLASTGCEVNTTDDTNNCGACGNVCSLAHATAGCSASGCVVASCNAGFADCDGVAANGCETDITLPANCGGCNTAAKPTACGTATPVCSASGCVTGCPASTPTLCTGGTCVNTTTDANDCSACGNVCALANATPACVSSACAVNSCNTGFADCNAKPTDGCEVNTTNDVKNCGACGKVCAFANATPTCSSSSCAIASCATGFADCDNTAADGCEVNTTNDVKNCGKCGTQCTFANASATCTSSNCAMSTCNTGFADCDNTAADGCEVNMTNDIKNCGACGKTCTFAHATATCSNSGCVLSSCNTSFVDCNNNSADGCEVNITNDPNNCGGCAKICKTPNATPGCTMSNCVVTSCNAGFADCNGIAGDGCEVDTASGDPNNCGGCGKVCSLANAVPACAASTCAVGSCAAGFMDCDHVATNGCEVNTTTNSNANATNCGGCGAAFNCSGGMTCQSGACVCPSGTTLCGGACVNLSGTDANNCGACGHGCLGGACSGGKCQPSLLADCVSEPPTPTSMVDTNSYYFQSGFNGATSGYNKVTGASVGIDTNGTGLPSGFTQDASNLYISSTGVCIESKTAPALGCNSLIYPTQGQMGPPPDIGTIATTGSGGLFWLGSPDIFEGSTSGTTAFAFDTTAGNQLVADANGVVWTESTGQLMTTNAMGARVALLTPAGASPVAVAIDASNAYWFNPSDSNLYRSARNGTSMANLTPGAPLARAVDELAVDASFVYWTDTTAGTVSRTPIAGGGPVSIVVNSAGADGIAVDTAATVAAGAPQAIYWIGNSTTGKCAGAQADTQISKLAK